jgi:cytochrome bd-type quinol oxidase subunit 2
MTTKSYTLAALIVFALLGVIDLIYTFTLDGQVYESNPLAATWLKNYGWGGLAIFKALTTLVVAAIVLIIRRHNPRTAAVLATAACLSVLAVALYSRNLLTMQENPSDGKQNTSVQIEND